MKTVLTGRSDLVRALRSGGPELLEAVARLLGMEALPPRQPEPIAIPLDRPMSDAPDSAEASPGPAPVEILVPYWYAKSFAAYESLTPADEAAVVNVKEPAPGPPPAPIPSHSLASGPTVLTKVRRVSAFERTTGEVDVNRVIARLSRGQLLETLPRRSRRSWGPSIQLVKDRHERLMPYWTDQDEVEDILGRVYPSDGLRVAILGEGASEPRLPDPRGKAGSALPDPGTPVLVLGDLGALERDSDRCRRLWLEWGRRYVENGNRPVALVPCDPSAIPAELAIYWTIIPWEGPLGSAAGAPGPGRAEELARRILTLLSFALRVDPELVRAVRRLLVVGRSGAGIDSLVWQSEAFQDRHYRGATFHQDTARELQERIESEPVETRRRVYEIMEQIRRRTYEGVWHAERLGLEREGALVGLPQQGLERAANWFRRERPLLEDLVPEEGRSGERATWNRRVLTRLPRETYQGQAADALHAIWPLISSTDQSPPDGLDPSRLPPSERDVQVFELRHFADNLLALPVSGLPNGGEAESRGSLLGSIRVRHPWIKVEPWTSLPSWVADWGTDQFGHWRTFQVKGVTQRLRWIPPGEFLMGSPVTEVGRDHDEGPQHRVRITRGFWLFDTSCTQALWQAVMRKNPSSFGSPTRPIENVSRKGCEVFVKRLNRLLGGGSFALPSEAQWEYACRAQTTTATYAGDLEILGSNNAPMLDGIAWYLGNCGVDFELPIGIDLSFWAEKQYDRKTGGTHPAGLKAPNKWGLYDMLGNVLEWCRDGFDPGFYEKSPQDNPISPSVADAPGVVRGGSWSSNAPRVRSANRDAHDPGYRNFDLGFRCGEFQDLGPAWAGDGWSKELSAAERSAEHRSDRELPSANRRPAWLGEGRATLVVPSLAPLRVSSDLEELVLGVMTRPAWASAIGRDSFGLWAEFTIGEAIRQRLRWIPPGRFVMGSPPGESGRFENEGSQRTLRISEGFWLFDTPCAQELWQTVMGNNPSRFHSPTRPVEQVGWKDCQQFVEKLNGLLESLVLSLPSEAQWEYACRAGTRTATYGGDLEILGLRNAPLLDGISWYAGNCGVDFELEEGLDISDWKEKQYDRKKGGTHPVGLKAPNGWGLYDMLGNVWEWCQDEYHVGSDTRGREAGQSAPRVVRGGSWVADVRHVRAACQVPCVPGARYAHLGLRCGEFRSGIVE